MSSLQEGKKTLPETSPQINSLLHCTGQKGVTYLSIKEGQVFLLPNYVHESPQHTVALLLTALPSALYSAGCVSASRGICAAAASRTTSGLARHLSSFPRSLFPCSWLEASSQHGGLSIVGLTAWWQAYKRVWQ